MFDQKDRKRRGILCSLAVSIILTGSIILGIGEKASAKDMKDFLIIGSAAKNWSDRLKGLGFNINVEVNTRYDLKKGIILPSYEELKKYDVLMLIPHSSLQKSEQNLLRFIENGGVLFWWYSGPGRTKRLNGNWPFKMLGFDAYKIVQGARDLDKRITPVEHNLKYASNKWGEGIIIKATATTYFYATDLFEAEAVVVDADNPERALVTVRNLGKGKVIFCGAWGPDLIGPIGMYLKRTLEYIGAVKTSAEVKKLITDNKR